MKRVLSFAAVIATVLSGLSVPAQAQTTLTMSSWLPPKHSIPADMIGPWIKQVEEATEGRVKIKTLPKPLGKPPAHFDIAREGTADLAYGIHGYQPGRFVLTSIAEMPFLGEDAETISVAYWRMYKKHLEKVNEHKGVKVIGVWTHGPGQIMNTKKELTSIAAMKDMKMRIGGGIVKEVTSNFGIAQLFMPAPAVYEALSRGVADGVMFPFEAIHGFKISKIITNVTRVPGGLYNTSFFFVMNEKKWNSLSDADKAAIDSVSGEAFVRQAGKAFQSYDAKGIALLEKEGGTITDAPQAMVEQIAGYVDSVEAGWAKKAAELGVDGHAVLDEMRAEIKTLDAN